MIEQRAYVCDNPKAYGKILLLFVEGTSFMLAEIALQSDVIVPPHSIMDLHCGKYFLKIPFSQNYLFSDWENSPQFFI